MKPTIIATIALFAAACEHEHTELTPQCEMPTLEGDPPCWLKVENHDNCYIWDREVSNEETATWSGQCQAGKAHGRGKYTSEYVGNRDTKTAYGIGSYINGKRNGQWKLWFEGAVWSGSYVDGEGHGQWEERYANGDVWVGPVVNSKKHGLWEKTRDGRHTCYEYSNSKLIKERGLCRKVDKIR